MRTALVIMTVAFAVAALGGEPADKAKAERIVKLKRMIAQDQEELARLTDEAMAKVKAKSEAGEPDSPAAGGDYKSMVKQKKISTARLAVSRLELAWLEDRLTVASAEKSIKDAEQALADAKDDAAKAKAQAALDAGRQSLAAVKGFEAGKNKGEF